MQFKLEELLKYEELGSLEASSKFDKAISNDGKKRQELEDFSTLVKHMKAFKSWCSQEVVSQDFPSTSERLAFYNYFESVIISAFWRYRKHKTTAWSFKKNLPFMLASAFLPALAAQALNALEQITSATAGSVNLISGGIIAFWFGFKVFTDWAKNKNAKETWVRHSVCFGRLNLALTRFVLSDRKKEAFQRFINDTDNILEQNLDQFALNLSANGLAKRANSKLEK